MTGGDSNVTQMTDTRLCFCSDDSREHRVRVPVRVPLRTEEARVFMTLTGSN